ncbi:sulfatase [Blastopirellula retiformator]|uniref:Choline-sulfatase n=1 Tax=Blastopirellula retiformator TaxID=2527970 RepID=A0A5C5UYJ7_9BACT|nr:sulfatase [Blastopirellula retiformator]TWT30919.1 Choline-sulfatase [Blastopirellula retiformator]
MVRLALGALLALPCIVSIALAEKPNILFIAIDDQNDWIGCFGGHPQAQTPYIDTLAARGTMFNNAHCQAPLCNSSRTSLLTGLRPSTTGIHGLAPWFRDVEGLSDLVTLPQYLRNNGYTTYSTGKIFHGGYGRRPKKDDEFDHLGPAASVGAKPKQKLVQTPNPHPLVDWGTFPHRDEDRGDYQVASWAVKTLNEKPKEPFFLSVGFFLPHVPCYATQQWFDLYPEDEVQLPTFAANDRDDTPRFSWYLHWKLPEPRQKFLAESGEWKNLVRSYLACTSFVDAQVGRVMEALEKNGYANNTVIVLWSDHGWHLGEKGITGKNTLWDRSTRVPLIFAGPGVAIHGKCEQPVELLDIYPTLIDLCGLPAKADLEGLTLSPQLQDANAKREQPAITTHNQGNHAVRTKRWRYIHYADGSEELYDMQADPQEMTNLAAKPELGDMKKELSAWLPKVDVHAAPGSAHRILTYDNDIPVWEGKVIHKDDPIPEL